MFALLQDLAQKLYSTNTVSSSARFQRPKLSQTAFTIQHYAGPVTYQTENFLDKNKDFVVAEHQQLLQESTTPFIRQLFAPDAVSSHQPQPACTQHDYSQPAYIASCASSSTSRTCLCSC